MIKWAMVKPRLHIVHLELGFKRRNCMSLFLSRLAGWVLKATCSVRRWQPHLYLAHQRWQDLGGWDPHPAPDTVPPERCSACSALHLHCPGKGSYSASHVFVCAQVSNLTYWHLALVTAPFLPSVHDSTYMEWPFPSSLTEAVSGLIQM